MLLLRPSWKWAVNDKLPESQQISPSKQNQNQELASGMSGENGGNFFQGK